MVRPNLSIVIPVFNEANRLSRTVSELKKIRRPGGVEIIFIDDGSSDNTKALIPEVPGWKVVRHPHNRGKGFAVRRGMLLARGERILFTDADLATPLSELARLETIMNRGFDVAIASRALKTSRSVTTQSTLRQVASVVFGLISKVLLVRGVGDSQCGFKLFTGVAGREIFSRCMSESVLFDMEALLVAGRCNLKVAEVACAWRHHPQSRLRYTIRSALALLYELLRLKWYHRVVFPVHIHAVQSER